MNSELLKLAEEPLCCFSPLLNPPLPLPPTIPSG